MLVHKCVLAGASNHVDSEASCRQSLGSHILWYAAGGLLSRVSASLSQLTGSNAQASDQAPGSNPAVESANVAELSNSQSGSATDAQAGRSPQSNLSSTQHYRSWWPFRRA